jgi:hypothetical protein
MVIIKIILDKITLMDRKLAISIAKIKKEANSFIEISFFHMK